MSEQIKQPDELAIDPIIWVQRERKCRSLFLRNIPEDGRTHPEIKRLGGEEQQQQREPTIQ
jgi:hypothetical protein